MNAQPTVPPQDASGPAEDAWHHNRPFNPTVADVLALPVFAAGLPQVITGDSALDRPVRWVHITELTDPASFLKGGELVLTTGMPLPEERTLVRRYVDELADIGAAGLVLELVRRYHRPPDELTRACRARNLPLITLSRDVNFLEVTQVVHALIVSNQTTALQRTQQIHEVFTALTLRGATPEDVLRTAAETCGHTMVLENLVHQAVFCAPSGGWTVEEALTHWERRSRATPASAAPGVHGPEGWLAAPVEYRGERWGRLIMLPFPTPATTCKNDRGHERPFEPEDVTVLERAAMALTIARLIHPTTWERRAHRNALADLAEQRYRSPGEARARAEALGLPISGSFLAALVELGPNADHTEAEEHLARELRATGQPVLIGELRSGSIGVLLAVSRSTPWRPVVELLGRAATMVAPQAVVSVGTEINDLSHAARSFREASRVAAAVPPGSSSGKPFHELSDIGLRQLLYSLRDDVRIQEYVERHLGRLIDHDARHGTDLVTTLHHYLDAAGSKTATARRGDLARQTVYYRLRQIERLLGCDLESGQQRTELHVALTALEALRPR